MSFSGQWKRNACCGYDQDDVPGSPKNLLIFEMFGYIYRTMPTWFDQNGQKMTPIQLSAEPNKLYYRYTFYKPDTTPPCGEMYHFATSDDIMPQIREASTGRMMKVRRIVRHNGYTNWRVEC